MDFHIMGGDIRQRYLAKMLESKGFSVSTSYLGTPDPPQWDADCLILPLPVSRDGQTLHAPLSKTTCSLARILARFSGKRLFGGMLPERFSGIDYFAAEEVTLANAVPTVEAALALAIANTPFTLWQQKVLVLGAGRIGQLLARRLIGLGAHVTVAARRAESLALVRNDGAEGRRFEDLNFNRYRLIFNTVPQIILEEHHLQQLPKGALLMELASSPGGFDPELAASFGILVLNAQGLPGKYAPETAAAIIGNYILKEMETVD